MRKALATLFFALRGKIGYMYTPSYGFKQSYGVTVKKFDDTTGMEVAFTDSQIGIGITKELGKGWNFGTGVATEYKEWDPEWYINIMKQWSF